MKLEVISVLTSPVTRLAAIK